jgi:hypothetical protein
MLYLVSINEFGCLVWDSAVAEWGLCALCHGVHPYPVRPLRLGDIDVLESTGWPRPVYRPAED